MTAPTRTLRVALAMRGGVSLSVWIGGAVHEVDHVRRLASPAASMHPTASPTLESDAALTEVIQRLGDVAAIEIDVIAGTSAGGLNGVLLASALRTGRKLDPLRLVWLDAADLQKIQRPVHTSDQLSLLDGRIFYDTLRDVLQREFFADTDPPPEGQRIDLLLPVTVLDGIALTAADDPTTPVTERRHDAVVHVRHHGPDPTWSDLVASDTSSSDRIVANLAAAARSTASFPGAFEPFLLPQPDAPTTDLKGTLITPVLRPATVQLVDGGVLDNIPVGKAVRAIAAAAADRPTERWLLYLQPNPTVDGPGSNTAASTADPQQGTAQPATMTKVLTKLAGALVNESLIDDLELLRAHNTDVLARQAERAVLLGRPLTTSPTEDRARFEAQCMVATLDRPHEEIAWWPIGTDVPGSQLAGWSTDARSRLADEIAAATLAGDDIAGLRPFEPLIRIGALLVEWAREIEPRAADPAEVGGCKRLAYLVTAWVEQAAGLADIAWLGALPTSPNTFDGATAVAVRRQVVASVEAGLELPVPGAEGDLGLVSTEPSAAVADGSTVSEQLRTALAGIAGSLARATPQQGDRDGLASMLARLLAGVPPTQLGDRLSALDAQLAPLHRGRALRDIAPIRYRTISGAAPTIFAATSSATDEGPIVGPSANHRFASVARVGPGLRSPVRPATKLAGNQISSFSAFLFRHWRANDWMWGRADAVRTLVETILDPASVKAAVTAAGPDPVIDIVRAYVTAPFPDEAAGGASAVASRLWSDNDATLGREIRDLAADGVPTQDSVSVVRELVIARRQLDIFALELARTGSDAVIAEAPGWERPKARDPQDALDERMDRWDRGVRRLGDIWGRRELTETGLRATLVGWKALLVDQGKAVRLIVAPLLAPLPLVFLGMFLNRRRAVAALAMLTTFVVSPRLERYNWGRWLFALSIVVGVGGLLWLLRHRSPGDGNYGADVVRGHGARWAWAAIAVAAYAVLVASRPSLWAGAQPPSADSRLVSAPYLVPAIAAAVAAGLLWCWAWWLPRLVMALFTAATALLWVWLAAPEPCARGTGVGSRCGLRGPAASFGSLWWGVLVVLYVSSWVAACHDFGRERHRSRRAAAAPNQANSTQ